MEDIIGKGIKNLISKHPFFGFYILALSRDYDTSFRSYAAVGLLPDNSVQLIFNPEKIKTLTVNETAGLVTHELLHVIYNHLFQTQRYTNHEVANIAEDLCINSIILKQYGMELPKDGLTPDRYSLSWLEGSSFYYKELMKKKEEIEEKESKNEELNESENNLKNDLESLNKATGDNLWKHERKECDGLSDVEKSLAKAQADNTFRRICEEIKNNSSDRGTIPGNIEQLLGELLKIKKATLDWRKLYKRYIGNNIDVTKRMTRKRESRRFPPAPGYIKNRKHKILFAIDTSGSMGHSDISEAFGEMHLGWKQGATIDVIECDTTINRIYPYDGKTPEFITGRGGTNIGPSIDFFNEHIKEYSCLVILTDGYHEHPKIKSTKDIIHLVTTNGAKADDFINLPYITIKMNNDV